ncbi:MAG: carbohydrate kinase [Spirochaetia bacterium]|nr:carbohydrate kinase [Spirochaetia bacterium]
MFDITALGELLIDFAPLGTTEGGVPAFGANPGGAPANLLAMASRLGRKTAFMGKVGDDAFGESLKQTLETYSIDTSALVLDKAFPTTLAFIHYDRGGNRSFSFYRHLGADTQLRADELRQEVIERCSLFHFGSLSLTDEPSRSATYEAVELAKKSGKLVSYDPNYRPLLWKSEKLALEQMSKAIAYAHIMKVSDEELGLLTGTNDIATGAKMVLAMGPVLLFVTAGPKGAYYFTDKHKGFIRAYKVRTIDTTGAGDAFFGAALSMLCSLTVETIKALRPEQLDHILAFANAAGSLTTTKKGAIPAQPTRDEILQCVKDAIFEA